MVWIAAIGKRDGMRELWLLAYEKMFESKGIFNKIPGVEIVSDKNTTGQILTRMKKYFPQDFEYVPKTFVYPNEKYDIEIYMKKH